MNVSASLDEVVSRDQIGQLVAIYAHCVWTSDFDRYVSLFADDAVIEQRGLGIRSTVRGKESLRHMIEAAGTIRRPRPLVHNHVVTLVDAQHATGSAYVEVLDGTTDDLVRNAVGYYRDEYVRVGGQWLFELRDLTFVFLSPRMRAAMRKAGRSEV